MRKIDFAKEWWVQSFSGFVIVARFEGGGKTKAITQNFFSPPQPENSQARISMSLRDIEILKIVAAVVDETHKLRNLVEKLVP